jgi:hypothetical protein
MTPWHLRKKARADGLSGNLSPPSRKQFIKSGGDTPCPEEDPLMTGISFTSREK